jgi:hypothetical protein
MGAIETKQLKKRIAELETENRRMSSDNRCMQILIETVRDQRDLLLKSTDRCITRLGLLIDADKCDEADQEAYDSARNAVKSVREWRQP